MKCKVQENVYTDLCLFFYGESQTFFSILAWKGKRKNGGVSSDKHPALLFIFSKRVDVIFSSVCDKETPKGSGHCMSTIWKNFTKWCDSGWTMSNCNIFRRHKPPMCKIMARQILLWSIHYICTFSLGDTSLSGNWKYRGVDFFERREKFPSVFKKMVYQFYSVCDDNFSNSSRPWNFVDTFYLLFNLD